MGSLLSSFLAEAVMHNLEKKTVADNEDITFWKRNVDDVFAIVETPLTTFASLKKKKKTTNFLS